MSTVLWVLLAPGESLGSVVVGTARQGMSRTPGTGGWQTRVARGGAAEGLWWGQGAGRLSLAGSLALTILFHKTRALTLLTSGLPCGWELSKCGGTVSIRGHLCPWRGGKEGQGWDRVQLRLQIAFSPGGQCREGLLESSSWFCT